MASITLNFKGETFTIEENRAFEAAEAVEDVMTIPQIVAMQDNPKFTKIAKCFGAMLRFAGAKVSDADVHKEMMREISSLEANEDASQAEEILATRALGALLEVLMDGAPEAESGEVSEKTKASSKQPSK